MTNNFDFTLSQKREIFTFFEKNCGPSTNSGIAIF